MQLNRARDQSTIRAALRRLFSEETEWYEASALNDHKIDYRQLKNMLRYANLPPDHPLKHDDFILAVSNALEILRTESMAKPAQHLVAASMVVPHSCTVVVRKILAGMMRSVVPQGSDMDDAVEFGELLDSWKIAVSEGVAEGYDAIKILMHKSLRVRTASALRRLSLNAPEWTQEGATRFAEQVASNVICQTGSWESLLMKQKERGQYHPFTREALRLVKRHLRSNYETYGNDFIITEHRLPEMSPAQMQRLEDELKASVSEGKTLLVEDAGLCSSIIPKNPFYDAGGESNIFVITVKQDVQSHETIVSAVVHEVARASAAAHLLRREKQAFARAGGDASEGRGL